jgi:hypothetical protein
VWSFFRINGRLRKRPDGPFRSEYIFGLLLDSSLMMGESSGSDMGGRRCVFPGAWRVEVEWYLSVGFPLLGLGGGRQ